MKTTAASLSNHEVVEKLTILVKEEKRIDAEILVLLKEVKLRKIYAAEGYGSLGDYCALVLGMSEDVAWKRSQAVDTIAAFPWALDMLKEGKTKISQVAMLRSKITKANEHIIKDFVADKSKTELKKFLDTVARDGSRIDVPPKVDLKLRCRKELMDKLNRVRSLKANSRFLPPYEEILETMADLWLEKHDPIEKAKRAVAKVEKKQVAKATPESRPVDCPGAGSKKTGRYIQASMRHELAIEFSQGCVFRSSDGKVCGSKHKLQIDHKIPLCHGGNHQRDNLRVLCAVHNQYLADLHLGTNFMRMSREGVSNKRLLR